VAQGSEAVCAKKARDPELCFLDLCVDLSLPSQYFVWPAALAI
jgi:hypothetical protein